MSLLQVKKRNLIYSEVIKRGLPRRYDRLHDNLELMADVFDTVIFFDYFFDIIALLVRSMTKRNYSPRINKLASKCFFMQVALYLSVSSLINGVKTDSVPWWMVGYTLLIMHYLLKMYQVREIST